jgi:hypothetical protein
VARAEAADEPDTDALAADLAELMRRSAAIDAGVADVRSRWKSRGGRPGAELQRVLDHLADVLPRLVSRIDRLHAELERRKGALQPELDRLARGRRMQKVYGRNAG